MDSILEQQRLLHEESDRLEIAIANELMQKPKSHKHKVLREHRILKYIKRIQKANTELLSIYEDAPGLRRKEIDAILSAADSGEFYKRLKGIKEYHRRFPDELAETFEAEFRNVNREKEFDDLETLFTGEENFGKHLDLNELHQQYVNLKDVDVVPYSKYLEILDQFDAIPETVKNAQYTRYLESLVNYLEGFLDRSQPLVNRQQLEQECRMEVQKLWNNRESSQTDRALFCAACQKLFSKQTVYDSHLTGKKHLKSWQELEKRGAFDEDLEKIMAKRIEELSDSKRQIFQLEMLSKKYLEALSQERADTRAAIERKQTLTLDEYHNRVTEEKDEVVEEVVDDDAEMEERFYNPLKLPIGWDGKPIPYWLYKLHGLGIEYPCEICGNFVYMGRKAFERHFQETRHAQSMRALGIANTKHFLEITKIGDALSLWNKMRSEAKTEMLKADTTEEFEDASGNVFSKKTYEDLKRQGLV